MPLEQKYFVALVPDFLQINGRRRHLDLLDGKLRRPCQDFPVQCDGGQAVEVDPLAVAASEVGEQVTASVLCCSALKYCFKLV